jgi:hypothetical protein
MNINNPKASSSITGSLKLGRKKFFEECQTDDPHKRFAVVEFL